MRQQYTTIIRHTISIILIIACGLNVCCPNASQASPQESNTHLFYDYVMEHRELPSTNDLTGSYRSYTLFVPKSDPALPKPPFPVAVLIPGFFRSGTQMRNNAEYLVNRGFIVITPNLSRILLFEKHRMHNVQTVMDEIAWLTEQNKIPGGALEGMVDPDRVALLGHCSGGAVCIEVLLAAQKAKIPICTFVSNDTVAWSRSLDRMSSIMPVDILSLRSEPGLCNEYGIALKYLRRLKFQYEDIVVKGAGHCDGENPTNFGCLCVCLGPSHKKYRDLFQLLTYLYFRDSLKAPALWSPTASFTQISQLLEGKGKITTKWYMPDNTLVQPASIAPRDN
jgi:Chlorophyllase enzyme